MPAGRSTFNKRQKEQQRQQKARDKAERRIQRKSEEPQAEVDKWRSCAGLQKSRPRCFTSGRMIRILRSSTKSSSKVHT